MGMQGMVRGVLPALAVVGALMGGTALAQERRFDIPPQPLASALSSYAQVTGLRLAYPAGLAAARRSPGVSGSLEPRDALLRLLAGTGLAPREADGGAVTLVALPEAAPRSAEDGAVQLPEVQVIDNAGPRNGIIGSPPPAYAGGQVATGGQLGLLGNRGVMDTPFSQTNYTSRTLQDQQARTVTDVLANDPSARVTWSEMSYTSAPYIRGFPVSSWDFSLNGLFGVVPGLAFSADSAERVEVLRGPSALLNGMPPLGSVGGTINIVPKRAGDEPITRLTTTYMSRSQFGGQIDVGRRFGDDRQWGARFNGTYRNGDISTDRQSQELGSAVLGLDYRGERVRLSLDLGYQKQNVESPLRPTYLATGIAVPKAPKATANWFQPWTYAHVDDWYGALRGEVDLTEDWTAYGAVGGRQNRSYLLSGFATIRNAAGDLTEAPYNFPVYHDSDSQELGLRGRFATGFVSHGVALTADRIHDESGSLFPVVATISSNLYNPTFIPVPSYARLTPPRTSEVELTSFGFADTMSVLEERVQLTWGLRQQRIASRNYSSSTGAVTSRYTSDALTPTVGLVLKPQENVSLYASYIEGLQQGATVGVAYANAGQVLPPFVSRQYEVGAKVDWGRFTTTAAMFQITQASGAANTATNVFTADGEQRNRGIELNGFGQVVDTVRVLGGVTFLQGRLTRTAGGANDGKTAPSVPSAQLNLGAEWDPPFLPGLTLSGRTIYTSGQYYDNANTQRIPDWVRFDIGLRYAFELRGKPVVVRGNILNIANRGYWAAANPTYGLSLGVPRTFLLSTSFDF
jgi:iron complex outermembrane recepter protein